MKYWTVVLLVWSGCAVNQSATDRRDAERGSYHGGVVYETIGSSPFSQNESENRRLQTNQKSSKHLIPFFYNTTVCTR